MPYKSAKQARFFHANKAKLEKQGVDVSEWDRSTDFSKLAGKPTSDYAEENQQAPGVKGQRARRTLAAMRAKH